MNPEKSMWEQDPGMIIYIALMIPLAGVEQLVDRWIGMSAEEKKPYVELAEQFKDYEDFKSVQ